MSNRNTDINIRPERKNGARSGKKSFRFFVFFLSTSRCGAFHPVFVFTFFFFRYEFLGGTGGGGDRSYFTLAWRFSSFFGGFNEIKFVVI